MAYNVEFSSEISQHFRLVNILSGKELTKTVFYSEVHFDADEKFSTLPHPNYVDNKNAIQESLGSKKPIFTSVQGVANLPKQSSSLPRYCHTIASPIRLHAHLHSHNPRRLLPRCHAHECGQSMCTEITEHVSNMESKDKTTSPQRKSHSKVSRQT